ncbi:MAG: shikimate dehydrogenase family protein [Candidatus Promineifilaceae bacterium]
MAEQTPILTGLIGWPLGYSLSPRLHAAAAAGLGIELVYAPMPVRPEALPAAVADLAARGYRGVNVTVPHKEAVAPLLEELEPAAAAIGAVNVIAFDQPKGDQPGRAVGYNTDWSGFLATAARLKLELAGRECWLLGAGGSARALVYALGRAGAQTLVFARRPEQAARLVADLGAELPAGRLAAQPWDELVGRARSAVAVGATPLIVNATPLGMPPQSEGSPWPAAAPFPPRAFVYDLVYAPAETALMRRARAAGCQVANGLGMLAEQAALSFALWTGLEPDRRVMRAAVG